MRIKEEIQDVFVDVNYSDRNHHYSPLLYCTLFRINLHSHTSPLQKHSSSPLSISTLIIIIRKVASQSDHPRRYVTYCHPEIGLQDHVSILHRTSTGPLHSSVKNHYSRATSTATTSYNFDANPEHQARCHVKKNFSHFGWISWRRGWCGYRILDKTLTPEVGQRDIEIRYWYVNRDIGPHIVSLLSSNRISYLESVRHVRLPTITST